VITEFPLRRAVFEHHFGVSSFPADRPIFCTDERYGEETQQRRAQLRSPHRDQYLIEPGSSDPRERRDRDRKSIGELYGWVCRRSDSLVCDDGGFRSRRSGESIDASELTFEWLGRNLQEDIVLLADAPRDGFPIVAGCVCFPSGWSLGEKFGHSLLDVHAAVPGYRDHLHPPAEKLFGRLKVGKTVQRCNWGVRGCGDLDQSPRREAQWKSGIASIDAVNAGRRCFFRVETQTITRLGFGWIVFTIRTRQCPLEQLSAAQQRTLRGVLASCPPETLAYKGIAPLLTSVLEYLDGRS
jgi:hypothetical protein